MGTDVGLAVRVVDSTQVKPPATGYLARPDSVTYAWLGDSRHIVYLKDLSGDENTQLYALDTEGSFDPWHVMPWPGTKSTFVSRGPAGTARFYFTTNRRDRA